MPNTDVRLTPNTRLLPFLSRPPGHHQTHILSVSPSLSPLPTNLSTTDSPFPKTLSSSTLGSAASANTTTRPSTTSNALTANTSLPISAALRTRCTSTPASESNHAGAGVAEAAEAEAAVTSGSRAAAEAAAAPILQAQTRRSSNMRPGQGSKDSRDEGGGSRSSRR